MAISPKWLSILLLASLALFFTVGCKPETPPSKTPQAGALVSPKSTPTIGVSVLPTPTVQPGDIEPTIAPTLTQPPVPTLLPTPVVTPIPVASPPFIPEVVGKAQQPFWIYYWQGNEVWRVDDQGKDRQLVIDPYKTLGQYLTDIPDPWKNTDCCQIGLRVAISPDGYKLALVVVDKIRGKMQDRFTFSIYILDVQTGDLKFVSDGLQPVWSPTNKQNAFLKGGGLWVSDLESGQVTKYAMGDPTKPEQKVYEMIWSPNGECLAYFLGESMNTNPELWLVDIGNPAEPRLLLPATYYSRGGLSWPPDGKEILYISGEGRGNGPESSDNLWSISVATGAAKQVTQDMFVSGWNWSPDGQWLIVNAARLYERLHPSYNLWLLSTDGLQLLRLTSLVPQTTGGFWIPDRTRLILSKEDRSVEILALDTGQITSVDFLAGVDFAIGGRK